MTNKRFVKLLMARGFSRDDAMEYVRQYLPQAGSYSSLYIRWLIGVSGSPEFEEALARLCEAAAAAARGIATALADMDWGKLGQSVATFATEAKEGVYDREIS